MNLILLEPGEVGAALPPGDPRSAHIRDVLRRRPGDLFDAGIVNGPRGKATVVAMGPAGIEFRFEPNAETPAADPIHLVIAVPRPQTARKILSEATSLGVASMRFFTSEKGETGYTSSTLWRTPEWRRHLMDGAAQAFDTRIPEILHHARLDEALAALPGGCARIALDNYESPRRMGPADLASPLALAFGPERGWSGDERNLLRAAGFELRHLGPRVLRTETAVVAAVSVAKSAA